MVDHIRRLGVFPANYALDLGEFIDSNGNSYIDIVELNPISCSMCYVNNSIYADVVPEIGECQRQLMMGAEFCYDAIANPKNYDMLRISNKSYTYTSDFAPDPHGLHKLPHDLPAPEQYKAPRRRYPIPEKAAGGYAWDAVPSFGQ